MKKTLLRGVSWDHSRAFPPLVATAQRFQELHPGTCIEWSKRTLHAFGHADLATLAHTYDLLIIDHPMMGDAEATASLTDLLPLLSTEEMEDMQGDEIGPSLSSYIYHGKLYALPIDAAAPTGSVRPDLLERHGLKEPKYWQDVVDLARQGWVMMPAFSADLFLNFMGLCVSRGSSIAEHPEQFLDHEIGTRCLEQLAEIAALMPDEIYQTNPIHLYERMSSEDDVAYCPFAYNYSNYSRRGFGAKHLQFSNPVLLENDVPIRTVLGGTGIAISSRCKEKEIALDYSRFIAGRSCQSTLYGLCGGQPARRSAWHDSLLNAISDDFFLRTAATIENAHVRPRYTGYVSLQVSAGEAIAEYCRHPGNPLHLLKKIDSLYRSSIKEGRHHV